MPNPGRSPWFLSMHSLERAQEMGLDRGDIIRVLNHPDIRYPSTGTHADTGRMVAVRDGLAVVYNPEQRAVVTILYHQRESRKE